MGLAADHDVCVTLTSFVIRYLDAETTFQKVFFLYFIISLFFAI